MRFLIDESADLNIGRALLRAGHDVKSIAQDLPSLADDAVLQLALEEERILVTEDSDFGRIVYVAGQANNGVIYLRYPQAARLEAPPDVVRLVQEHGARLEGAFVVMRPGHIRISRRPTGT